MDLKNAKIISYADDTAVIFTGASWEEVKAEAELGLAEIATWLQQNLLTLNVSKTNYVCFSIYNNGQPQNDFNIKIHGCARNVDVNSCDCLPIAKVSQVKYLGVYVDQRLSWYPQLDHVINRTRKLIWIFKTLRHVVPEQMRQNDSSPKHLLNQIYTSLVQSILTYCITIWGGAAKTQFLGLERAQRSLIKVMYFKKRRFSTEELYQISGLLSVRKLYIMATILKTHKYLPYDLTLLNKRRRDIVAQLPTIKTAFASRQYLSNSGFLYNKINKLLYIYDKNYQECKKLLAKWLLSKSYEETEALLEHIT